MKSKLWAVASALILIAVALPATAQFPSNGNFPAANNGHFGGYGGYNNYGGGVFGSATQGRSVSHRGNDYGEADARRVQDVVLGVVEDVRVVDISSKSNTGQVVGGALGAAVGGVAGNKVGNGSGRTLATIAGAAIGGLTGAAIGDKFSETHRRSIEVVVSLDNGRAIVVTQEEDGNVLNPGDRVRIVHGSVTRVVKMQHSTTPQQQAQIYRVGY